MAKCRLAAKRAMIAISTASTRVKSSANTGSTSNPPSSSRPAARSRGGGGLRGGSGGPAWPCCPGASGRPRRPHGRKMRTTAITANHEHQGALGDDQDPERVEFRDEHRGEEGAGDAAHASDHHHHEHRGEDVEVHQQVRAPFRELGRAAEAGEHRAEKKGAVNSHAWLTPSAPTISRSSVAARTRVPQRVR